METGTGSTELAAVPLGAVVLMSLFTSLAGWASWRYWSD